MAILELDQFVLADKRFSALGDLTGRGEFDARARVENLWYFSIVETNDIWSAEDIDKYCGWFEETPFAELMVRSKLAVVVDPVTGEKPIDPSQVTGYFRVKGVADRMEWLLDYRAKRSEAGKIGGKKTASKLQRGKNGRFIQTPANQVTGDDQSPTNQNQAKPAYSVTATVTGTNSEEEKKLKLAPQSRKAIPCGAILDLAGDAEVEEFLEQISHSAQKRWLKLYPEPEFITTEILKAIQYLEDNPRKRPKSRPASFMGAWLARGWEWRRKRVAGNQSGGIDYSKIGGGVS